jgi:diguanylate cyclase
VSALGTETARFGSTLSAAQERFGATPNPERIRSILRGIVEETSRMQGHADRVEAHLRTSAAEIDELRRDLQAARSEARTDALTGLANRKHFDQALRVAAAQAIDQGSPACLALADIDHFKRFNDLYGHALATRCSGWSRACSGRTSRDRTWWRGTAARNSPRSCRRPGCRTPTR